MRDVNGRMEGTGLENRCAADKSFYYILPLSQASRHRVAALCMTIPSGQGARVGQWIPDGAGERGE